MFFYLLILYWLYISRLEVFYANDEKKVCKCGIKK